MKMWIRSRAVAAWSLAFSAGCLTMAGCDRRGLEQARQEATEARVKVVKLEKNLADRQQEIRHLEAELKAVGRTRDELQERIALLIDERDQVATFAQEAQKQITTLAAQASGQAGTTTALQQQVAELKALVKEQQTIIEELQKGMAGGPDAVEPPVKIADEGSPPEPNELP